VPDIKKEELQVYTKLPLVAELVTNSLSKRPDLLGNDAMKKIAELNYLLERKRAIPDVNFMMSNDQRGGAFVNQTNIGISVPLPTWNRNRGNIEAAQWEAKSADVLYQEKQNEIRQQVMQAYVNMDRSIKEYERANLYYTIDFENVFKAIKENFAKRNISVLEFLDFFEAYNIAVTEFERIRAQLGITAASMNFVAGYKVY
jgi:cobalt-zinc-cadmium efflux system outer membrane protein